MALKTEAQIRQGFRDDGYEVKQVETFQGKRGMLAEHRTAKNTVTGQPKRAFYVEGNGYQMGYLMGLLAETDVRRMTGEFANNVIPAFVSPTLTGLGRNVVLQTLLELVRQYCYVNHAVHPTDIPQPLQDEMHGIADGCRARVPATPVRYENVLALNVGQDILVSVAYTGLGLYERIEKILPKLGGVFPFLSKFSWLIPLAKALLPKLKAEFFRVPLACNAFAAFGNAVSDQKCYFGRDFMFPAAGVLQDTACMIVYNPEYQLDDGRAALPLVSMSAPGFCGSITAMNSAGVGIGVDMAPSGNCDPLRPGLNSLLLARHAGHCGYGATGAVDTMVAAQRGASWIYPVADGPNRRAAVVESGRTVSKLDYLSYPPEEYKPLLPKGPFQPSQRGLFVRWNDWQYPAQYMQFNQALFQKMGYEYDPAKFGPSGMLNPSWHGGPVEQGYFFAPRRGTKDDLLVVTNHFLVPEMRLCAMCEWTNIVAKDKIGDILWRYDTLNKLCDDAYGSIDHDRARDLSDFLRPGGPYGAYYEGNPVIEGTISLCELTGRVMESHFGYHTDDWVKLSLMNYV